MKDTSLGKSQLPDVMASVWMQMADANVGSILVMTENTPHISFVAGIITERGELPALATFCNALLHY
jgi:hypothetical protein